MPDVEPDQLGIAQDIRQAETPAVRLSRGASGKRPSAPSDRHQHRDAGEREDPGHADGALEKGAATKDSANTRAMSSR